MAVAAIQKFGGMVPIMDRALLIDSSAQSIVPGGLFSASAYCLNAFVYYANVEGWRAPKLAHTLLYTETKSVYRIPMTDGVPADFTESRWIEFSDPYMSVARAPMIEDQFKRYYFFPSSFAGPNRGPYYNTRQRILERENDYILGVPFPEVAPTVTNDHGDKAVQEVRAYVYTWSTSFSEEGPPSPPAVLQGTVTGAWRLTINAPLPSDKARRDLKWTNIYRTVTDNTGVATYYRIAQVPITQQHFLDRFLDTEITSNLILESVSFTAPPGDLQGVVVMANGILAGFSNSKEVWFSAAYRPHAWPVAYALTVDAPIIGLAAVGSSLVVITEGCPWIATGVTPDTMTIGKITARDPCISRGSIAVAGEGVYYASPNGLILVNTSGTVNTTLALMTKEQWLATGVLNFAASKYNSSYLAFSKGSQVENNGIVVDTSSPNVGFGWLSTPQEVDNVYDDELSGSTFIITNGQVLEWNATSSQPDLDPWLPFIWTTKQYRFPYAQDFVGGMIYFEIPDNVTIPVPSAATRNTRQDQIYDPTTQYLLLRAYADNKLVFVRELQVSGELFLLPSLKATYWQFSVQGIVRVKEMKFGDSIKALMKV